MYKLITLSAALFISVNISFAQTPISGQIRNNTTWTKAGSPYICTGLIEVDTYATLTIEPGTVVELDKNIDVYGGVVFKHNSTDTTVIKTNNTSAMPFIRTLNKNYTDSIVLKRYKFTGAGLIVGWHSMVIIENCILTRSHVTWRPSGKQTFIFENNKCFEAGMHLSTKVGPPGGGGIKGEAENLKIKNNIFETNSGIDGQVDNINIVEITDNIFLGSGLNLSTSGMLVSDNIFYKSSGIFLWPPSKPVKIVSNVFFENDVAIYMTGVDGDTVEIRNNSIYNNNVGVVAVGSRFLLTGNCIYDNKDAGLSWTGGYDVTIGSNWWGTTDTSKIDSSIIDDKDDFKRGVVTYIPFLTVNNPNCKTYTKTEELPVQKNEVKTYPNPFLNTLEFKSGKSIKAVYLYNLVGKVVYQSKHNSRSVSINTKEFPTGVYLYRIITDNEEIHTGKIIKQ